VKEPAQSRAKTVAPGDAPEYPANLPGLPPAAGDAATASPADNGRGMDGSGEDAGRLERAKAAAARTVAEHLDSKNRGKAGRATAPSLARPAALADDADDGPVAPLETVDFADDLEDGGPDCEQEFIAAGSELVVDSLNDGAATLMELWALHHLAGDVDKAAAAAKKVRMNPRREERIRKAIARLASKNPERAAKLFGLLLYWDPALWVGDVGKQFQAVKAAGQRLRVGPPPAVSSAPTVTAAAVVTPTPAAIPAARNGDEPDFQV
jgi:hypothetical protein